MSDPSHEEPTSGPPYEVLELIGRGGMGEVYRGRHVLLDKEVAIKMVANASADARFLREARLAAKVESPNTVRVYDFQLMADGRAMLVMEFVRGRTLEKSIKDGALAIEELGRFMTDGARGMVAVSDMGIVHRDLKPANMLIDSQHVLRIADFGIARLGSSSVDANFSTMTGAGAFMGTPAYVAPEQAEDPHSADVRSDIYSYGATFYHAATGSPVFAGSGAFSVLMKHKLEPIVSPRAHRGELPKQTVDVLERCLAKSPGDRFQSFEEVLGALEGGRDAAWKDANDQAAEVYMSQYRAAREGILNGSRVGDGGIAIEFKFPNGRILRIRRGDLTEATTEAVVSSDDEILSMGGGVSAALNRASGWALQAEAKIYERVRHGGVVVTGGGALKARFVFHAVTVDYQVDDDGHVLEAGIKLPSRDIVLQLLSGCFYHAQTLRIKSIAFPVLGAGAGGLDTEVALDTMVGQLVRVLLHGAHSVDRAEVYLFDGRRDAAPAIQLRPWRKS